jgi:hypothetical protein
MKTRYMAALILSLLLTLVLVIGCSSTPGNDSQIEGIQVHGHWTIEVLDVNNNSVQKVEFDNELQTTGAETLAKVMAGDWTIGGWSINLGAHTDEPGTDTIFIVEDWYTSDAGVDSTDLTVVAEAGVLTLTCSATAEAGMTDIYSVWTRSGRLPYEAAPVYGGLFGFTSTSITPIPVTEGQTILVTVEISFS